MSTADHSLILDHETIRRKITRMAYEIVENNFGEKTIVLAGIEGQGHVLARLLEKEIRAISKMDVLPVKIRIDKSAPEKSE
ncbi:MAG: phosphoribosyltransferase, partial [Bacteroidota bacterium]